MRNASRALVYGRKEPLHSFETEKRAASLMDNIELAIRVFTERYIAKRNRR